MLRDAADAQTPSRCACCSSVLTPPLWRPAVALSYQSEQKLELAQLEVARVAALATDVHVRHRQQTHAQAVCGRFFLV